MSGLLVTLVIAALVAGAFALLLRSFRPSDERVLEFGPAIEAAMRATKVPDSRTMWQLDDPDRGIRATFDLFSNGVFVELHPLGSDEEPDYETAPKAGWERDAEEVGAAFEVSPESAEYPNAPWLEDLLRPALERLRPLPISSVSVILPRFDATVHARGNGAEAAQVVARVYPQVREVFERISTAEAVTDAVQ